MLTVWVVFDSVKSIHTLLFSGMKYLHQEKTIHRDLKSSNGKLHSIRTSRN